MNWPNPIYAVAKLIQRFRRRRVKQTFVKTVNEVNALKELVEQTKCVACGQQSLQLVQFGRNPNGWEAYVACSNCNVEGMINADGFNFVRVNSQGKAVESKGKAVE